jgi:hypothetical protein
VEEVGLSQAPVTPPLSAHFLQECQAYQHFST